KRAHLPYILIAERQRPSNEAYGNLHPGPDCMVQAANQRDVTSGGRKAYLLPIAAHHLKCPQKIIVAPQQITTPHNNQDEESCRRSEKDKPFDLPWVLQKQKDEHNCGPSDEKLFYEVPNRRTDGHQQNPPRARRFKVKKHRPKAEHGYQ